jgi:predicted DNA-binding transcriptional regulator AlpA
MQVTEAMVAAADAQLLPVGGEDGELISIGYVREWLPAAIQVALDAAGDIDLPINANVRVTIDRAAFYRSIVEAVDRLHATLPKDDDGRIDIATMQAAIRTPATGGVIRMATPEERTQRLRELPGTLATRRRSPWPGQHGPELVEPIRLTGDRSRIADRMAAYCEPIVTDAGLEGPDVTDATGQSGIPVSSPTTPGSFTFDLGAEYNPLELVSLPAIAAHLGVSEDQVDEWVKLGPRIRFPEPIKRLATGPLYHLGAIDEWYQGQKTSGDG